MALPAEIRLMIYPHVLKTGEDITLRRPDELEEILEDSEFDTVILSRCTSILFACRTTFQEGISLFYKSNKFHWALSEPLEDWPTRFSNHFQHITQLSLEYIDDYPAVQVQNNESGFCIEMAISSLVEQVDNQCPNLRLFSLFILSTPKTHAFHLDFFEDFFVATALRNLLPRLTGLTIVTFGPAKLMLRFRLGIAPAEKWVTRNPRSWPNVSMSGWQNYGIQLRWDAWGNEGVWQWFTGTQEFLDGLGK
ncbi:hypothetical protein MMC28_003829 [Mycoblastus sanguinarius]|nr:hypothetical protein [Mycoblastus sanguinarius]